MQQKRPKYKKPARRSYKSNRELLLEFSYIKIENVFYNTSYYNQSVYVNTTEEERDKASNYWWNGPVGFQNNRINIYSSSVDTSDFKNHLNHSNIGKYKNLTTLYNSSMYRIYYIDADWTSKEDEGIYIIHNKHKMLVYWKEELLEDIIKSCEKELVKHISRKNNENNQFNKKNFYKSREMSRYQDSRHKQYNKNFMRR